MPGKALVDRTGRPIHLKLGKRPARKGAVKLMLTKYIDYSKLPKIPAAFGHDGIIPPKAWGMFGNDQFGDCVWAGAAHETILWTRLGEAPDASFTSAAVLGDYSTVTGFDPKQTDANGDNPTDQGTDMEEAARYRRNTGILDATGNRHKIAGFIAIPPGDVKAHMAALFLFNAVGIGIEFPSTAMDQFNKGKPWDVVPRARVEGGHYICLTGRPKAGIMNCITWGQVQPMTDKFLRKYNDESLAYISEEALTMRKSPDGFDYDALMADLAALNPNSHVAEAEGGPQTA